MSHRPRMTLSGVVLDAPDPRTLAAFYARLLGWEVRADEPGLGLACSARRRAGAVLPARAALHPAWPAAAGEQQMMAHLDIRVDDLDPVGHPFSLFP